MNGTLCKLLTIITETALESVLIKEIEALGARGYTIIDARGKGRRGPRDAAWNESSNIRIEILCNAEIADAIARHLQVHHYDDYGMVLFVNDVSMLRSEKF